MKVALIGGASRSARAFAAWSAREAPDLEWRAFVRRPDPRDDPRTAVVADYEAITPDHLRGCDAVVNFVGATRGTDEAELMRVNAALAQRLAAAARAAGAGQFIQLSSLSLYGRAGRVDAETPFAPVTAYGRSKLAAEGLLAPMGDGSFRVTLLRIPIVYGPGAPSKLRSLAGLLRYARLLPAPRPLPRRSIISYDNLSLVLLDLLRSRKAGIVFAADPQPFRLDLFARALPFRARILALPPALFAPLRVAAPSLHASLYTPLEIAPECLLRPAGRPLIATEAGLRAAFGRPAEAGAVTGSQELR